MSWGRICVRVGAPVATGVGVILGVMGTFLICKPYHPFTVWGLVRHLRSVIWCAIRKGPSQASGLVRTASRLSEINEEDRAKSLVGVYLVFLGFVMQAFGALLWTIDASLGP